MFNIGDLIGERYEILDKANSGGMAFVFPARDVQTGQKVALKTLQPIRRDDQDSIQRFRREGVVHSKLTHPNIVRMIGTEAVDYDKKSLMMVLVFEWIKGGNTLESLLGSYQTKLEQAKANGEIQGLPGPCLPLSIGLRLMAQVASAIAFAHEQGFIHRDIKPSNIMLHQTEQGELVAKVADFGTAKAMQFITEVGPKVTKTGSTMGTPYYMSPEQGMGKFGEFNDIWSYWVMMYELLTGVLPFNASSITEWGQLWIKIASGTAAHQPIHELCEGVPEDLELLVNHGLDKDKDRRPCMKDAALFLEMMAKENEDPAMAATVLKMLVTSIIPPKTPPKHDPNQETLDLTGMTMSLDKHPTPHDLQPVSVKLNGYAHKAGSPAAAPKAEPPKIPEVVMVAPVSATQLKAVTEKRIPVVVKETPQTVVVAPNKPLPPVSRVVAARPQATTSSRLRVMPQATPPKARPATKQVVTPLPPKPAPKASWVKPLILAAGLLILGWFVTQYWLPSLQGNAGNEQAPATSQTADPKSAPVATSQPVPTYVSPSINPTAHLPTVPAKSPKRPLRPGHVKTTEGVVEGLPPGTTPPTEP